MPFDSKEIFLFAALVPLLIVIGRKIRGKSAPPAHEHESGQKSYPSDLQRKIENGYYSEGETVLLAAFESDVEANIVWGLLIDNAIFAEIRDESIGATDATGGSGSTLRTRRIQAVTRFSYSYAVGGVKLFVHERELAEARELMARHQEITQFDSQDWQPKTCPQCASDMLTYQKYHPVSALILFLGAPFVPLKAGRWVCLKCSHKWKE